MTTPDPTPELSTLLELCLLRAELSETAVAQGCELAKLRGMAAVVLRPADLDLAARWVSGSPVAPAAVVDVHGHDVTAVKTYAVREMLRRGARAIYTTLNTGKMISRQFQYLESELQQMADSCRQAGAQFTVALASQHLDAELKIVACRICRRAGVDGISTPALDDLPLLKEYGKDRLRFHGSGAETLDQVLAFRAAGCARIQTEHAAAILDAWDARLEEAGQAAVIS